MSQNQHTPTSTPPDSPVLLTPTFDTPVLPNTLDEVLNADISKRGPNRVRDIFLAIRLNLNRSMTSLTRLAIIMGLVAIALAIYFWPPTQLPSNDAPLIAIMGKTGAGKSTFIDLVGGRSLESNKRPDVGHGMRACTKNLTLYKAVVNERDLYLIDTPGFDDTVLTDTQVLERISLELAALYRGKRLLNGIIYLQEINHARMTGSSLKYFSMFKELVGNSGFGNVVLVTNKWTPVTPVTEVAAALEGLRERELVRDWWAPMIKHGSRTFRHDGSRASGVAILTRMLALPAFVTQLQRELVDQELPLFKASAGRIAGAALAAYNSKLEDELRSLRNVMEVLRNDGARDKEELRKVSELYEWTKGALKESNLKEEQYYNQWRSLEEDFNRQSETLLRMIEEHGKREQESAHDKEELERVNRLCERTQDQLMESILQQERCYGQLRHSEQESKRQSESLLGRIKDHEKKEHIMLTIIVGLVLVALLGRFWVFCRFRKVQKMM